MATDPDEQQLIPLPRPCFQVALFTPTPNAEKRMLGFFTAQINNDLVARVCRPHWTQAVSTASDNSGVMSAPRFVPAAFPLAIWRKKRFADL